MASAAILCGTGGGQTHFLWRWLCRCSVQTQVEAPLLGIAGASVRRPTPVLCSFFNNLPRLY